MTQLYTLKTAAPRVVASASGLALRRKLPQRGFYRDPSPGIYGLREGFDAAARASHAKEAAAQTAARLFGVAAAPVDAMTQLFRRKPFLPRKPPPADAERGSGSRYSPPTNVREIV